MRWEYRPDNGFGTSLDIGIGWLWLSYSRFEDHIYLSAMWARPLVVAQETQTKAKHQRMASIRKGEA